MDVMDELTRHFSRNRSAFILAKAIMADYCEVVARIEGTTAIAIKDRINDKAIRLDQELRDNDNAQEAKPKSA